jgi:macrolide transport system ATP-binding/permease protein
MMDAVWQDVRYGVRTLLKSPGFSLVAVATLALGIGVNSSIFSLVNAVLLKPLPVQDPHELVNVYSHHATSTEYDTHSYPDFLDYRARTQTLSGMMAYSNFFANLSIEGSSELVVGEVVSEDYFDLLGVRPALGRAFTADEFAAEGASPVAVLNHGFWQRRFEGDPGILGRTFRLNGTVYTVVGVAPPAFGGMFPAVSAQMWVPLSMVEEVEPLGAQRFTGPSTGETRLERRGAHFLWVKGRMRPGTEVATVQAELEGIAARLAEEHPETNHLERVKVFATNDVAFTPDIDQVVAPVGLVLLGAVGLVLLVACANLANMLLARATARRKEVAVRLALGAGRVRLVRQMLTESLILAMVGGGVAMLLAFWLAGLIAGLQPPLPIDLGLSIGPDWRVLGFTLLMAAGTGILFGLVPALRASRPNLVPALKDGGQGDTGQRRKVELRDALVVVQVAVSVVLLVAGSLMVRSLGAAARVEFGYDVARTAHLDLAMEMNGYDPEAAGAFLAAGKLRLRTVPQVEAVSLATRIPLSINNNGFGIFIDGRQSASSDAPFRMNGAYVDEDYLSTLGLQVLEGRGILPEDRDPAHRVAVVTQTLARQYWPGESAVGKEFRTRWGADPHRIVGVVEDHKVDTPGERPKPYLLLPIPVSTAYGVFLVRTATPAAALVPRLEGELRALDADLVFLDTGTLQDLADVRLFPVLAGAWLIGVFGLLALVLASVGLYGVIGYAVSRRIREIGIRKALGAETSSVIGMILRQGMVLVGIGFVAGAGLGALAARLLSSALFVDTFDIPSFGAALLILAGVATLANLVPALRASRVDPVVALKTE